MFSVLKTCSILAAGLFFGGIGLAFGASSCQGINLERSYHVLGVCQFDGKFLANGSIMQLSKQGNEENCTFTATATKTETSTEYSITPPPGVIVGPYDMCALWAFENGSRPGSFPKDMVEPCRIWQNRPPDRVITKRFDLSEDLSSDSVILDISRRVSNISSCQVR